MPDRAILFIDGSNWYHGLGRIGVRHRARLDYRKISEKLVGPREWLGTRYYIGQLVQDGNTALYAQQRTFLATLERTDPRISVHLGRIEPRRFENKAAKELRHYLVVRRLLFGSARRDGLKPVLRYDLRAELTAGRLLRDRGEALRAVAGVRGLRLGLPA